MQNNQSETYQKSYYTRIKNRYESKWGFDLGSRLFRKDIEKGILPDYFNYFYHESLQMEWRVKQARSRFRNNNKLKNEAHRRAGGKCQTCGSKEWLEVDHIKSVIKHPELASELNNLRVLCRKCHKKKHSKADEVDKRHKGYDRGYAQRQFEEEQKQFLMLPEDQKKLVIEKHIVAHIERGVLTKEKAVEYRKKIYNQYGILETIDF